MNKIKIGKVYLVGAGPGNPELITIKAGRILTEADIVYYDQLVNPEILKLCKHKAVLISVGKERSKHSVEQESINDLLYKSSLKYKVVVRLKGGDPSVFGRVGEEYFYLLKKGIEAEIIPGVTTASGGAASIGLPLTHRDYSSEIVFITGHKKDGINLDKLSNFVCKDKTLVVYMGLFSNKEISSKLLEVNENKEIPVLILQNATLKNEKFYLCTLKSLSKTIDKNKIQSPAIIIIGEIVKLLKVKTKLEKYNLKLI